MNQLPSKLIGETITVTFNFSAFPYNYTLSAPVCTVVVLEGVDDGPSQLLEGTASITGRIVTQQFARGSAGVVYGLVCDVQIGSSRHTQMQKTLAVLSTDGDFGPGRITIEGTLPPTACQDEAYYETLDIIGGHQPFTVEVTSGALPAGVSVYAVGQLLVFSGVPTTLATYNFTVQVTDTNGVVGSTTQTVQVIFCGVVMETEYTTVGDAGNIWGTETFTGPWISYAQATGARNFLCIAQGNGVSITVGNGGAPSTNIVFSSPNRKVWTQRDLSTFIAGGGGIAYSPTLELFCYGGGNDTSGDNKIVTTPDGVNWTTQTPPGGMSDLLTRMIWGKDTFVGSTEGGEIIYSSNGLGTNWASISVTNYLGGVCYNADDDEYLAVGTDGKWFTSPDAAGPWTQAGDAGSMTFSDCAYRTGIGYFACVTSGSGQGIYSLTAGVMTLVQTMVASEHAIFCYGATEDHGASYVGTTGALYRCTTDKTVWTRQVVDAATTNYGMVVGEVPA